MYSTRPHVSGLGSRSTHSILERSTSRHLTVSRVLGTISFNQHVNKICKSSYDHIKALRHICKLLSDDAARTVACALVAGRLDYCNAVLYGSSYMNIDKLQRVQNTLDRVVSKTHRRDHITPVLADLHWLPVHYRIEYKIALLTYKAPTIQTTVFVRTHSSLRDSKTATISRCQHPAVVNFSRSAFCHASPIIWNNLPETVISDITVSTDTFKSRLKTALYSGAFLH